MRLSQKQVTPLLGNKDDSRERVKNIATNRILLRVVGVEIDDILYKQAILRSLSSIFRYFAVALGAQIDIILVVYLRAKINRKRPLRKFLT